MVQSLKKRQDENQTNKNLNYSERTIHELFKPAYIVEIWAKSLVTFIFTIVFILIPIYLLLYFSSNLHGINILVIVIIIIYFLLLISHKNKIIKNFFDECIEKISRFLFFNIYTKKGKALTKKDFNIIRSKNRKMYDHIKRQNCDGQCYYTSYLLCQLLKKGKIEYIAVKSLDSNATKPFYIHVLYVNNDWCFDTYSCRQYSLEHYCDIQEIKIFKAFEYDEIKDMSPEEFRVKFHENELRKWISKNDCSFFVRK